MGVVVQFDKQKAILRGGLWRSADLRLESSLNLATEQWIRETGRPSQKARDPEREVAEEMALRYAGSIIYYTPAKNKEAARVFFRKRQLTLF